VKCSSFRWLPQEDTAGQGRYSTDRHRCPKHKHRSRPGSAEDNPARRWNRTHPCEPRARTGSVQACCPAGRPECHPADRHPPAERSVHHPGAETRPPHLRPHQTQESRRSQENRRSQEIRRSREIRQTLVIHPCLSPDRGLRRFRQTPSSYRGRRKPRPKLPREASAPEVLFAC